MSNSCAYHDKDRIAGSRTQLWRALSWLVGDKHASRICFLIDIYAFVFRVDIKKLRGYFP